jgi:hypothetical protein
MKMNICVNIETDAATIALFDPAVLVHRDKSEECWWSGLATKITEIAKGDIGLVGTGGDGCFSVRVQTGEMSGTERDYAKLHSSQGVRVISGRLYVGKGECLPGYGALYPDVSDGSGLYVDLPNGTYQLRVYEVDWTQSGKWWDEEGPVSQNAPPDYVVTINEGVPVIDFHNGSQGLIDSKFAFDSADRQIGPIAGQILRTKVYKSDSGLVLNECGPCLLKPIPQNWEGVKWLDKVQIRVLNVNLRQKTMSVEILRVLND